MYLGYNTNGFAHHRLEDALTILAELGYQGVGLTLDYHTVNPFEPDWHRKAERVRRQLDALGMRCVIETGARFLLDPRRKHQPTLVSSRPEEVALRLDFLRLAVDVAEVLGSDVVSFWSGTLANPGETGERWAQMVDGCRALASYAAPKGVRLAFEPEPGMLVATLIDYEWVEGIGIGPNFGLTLDVGHLHCQGETPIPQKIRRYFDAILNVHIEDMRWGVHDHLMFGEGEMDFPPILAALKDVGYKGGVFVELSRHSHDAVETARRAIEFLRAAGACE
jgi:sugar phosphate isomerase/epimerase